MEQTETTLKKSIILPRDINTFKYGECEKEFFVINLKRSTERLEKFLEYNKEYLYSNNIKVFEGTDGLTTKFTDSSISHYFKNIGPSRNIGGNWGCTLSHVRLWQHIAEAEKDNIITFIFEDDAIIKPDFKEIDKLVNNVPPNWDIIYLYSNDKNSSHHIFSNRICFASNHNYSCGQGTVAYILNKKGAKKLLQGFLPLIESEYLDIRMIKVCKELFIKAYFAISDNYVCHDFTVPSIRNITNDLAATKTVKKYGYKKIKMN
jgi:GR25 family glycosyltransferase involved in LPS biosynthesis